MDWNCFDSGKRSPLHPAVGQGNSDILVAVLDAAKSEGGRERSRGFVHARDEYGDIWWDGAKKRGNKRIMETLRRGGVEVKGMYGWVS